MNCKIEMPKAADKFVPKDSIPSFVPILVKDTDTDKTATVMIHRAKDSVIWFDQNGWIGHSDMEYFNRDRFVIIRKYESGEKLTITQL